MICYPRLGPIIRLSPLSKYRHFSPGREDSYCDREIQLPTYHYNYLSVSARTYVIGLCCALAEFGVAI
jgi:hypothetical protein